MLTTFPTHFHILPPEQQRYWPKFKGVSEEGFVLYGGTAIALRLGHRTSVDFDFFSHLPLDRKSLFHRFPFLKDGVEIPTEDGSGQNTFTCTLPSLTGAKPLKVSFFGTIDFGRLQEPSWTDDGNLLVASLDDLLAQKLKVVLQRVEIKDYLDIAELLYSGQSLTQGLAGSAAIFKNSFPPSIAVATLNYFEGLDTSQFPPHRMQFLQQATTNLINKGTFNLPKRRIQSHYLTDDELSRQLPAEKQLQYVCSLLKEQSKNTFQNLVGISKSPSPRDQLRLAERILSLQDKGIEVDPQMLQDRLAAKISSDKER